MKIDWHTGWQPGQLINESVTTVPLRRENKRFAREQDFVVTDGDHTRRARKSVTAAAVYKTQQPDRHTTETQRETTHRYTETGTVKRTDKRNNIHGKGRKTSRQRIKYDKHGIHGERQQQKHRYGEHRATKKTQRNRERQRGRYRDGKRRAMYIIKKKDILTGET